MSTRIMKYESQVVKLSPDNIAGQVRKVILRYYCKFFLSGYFFTKSHDSKASRGRGRLFL